MICADAATTKRSAEPAPAATEPGAAVAVERTAAVVITSLPELPTNVKSVCVLAVNVTPPVFADATTSSTAASSAASFPVR